MSFGTEMSFPVAYSNITNIYRTKKKKKGGSFKMKEEKKKKLPHNSSIWNGDWGGGVDWTHYKEFSTRKYIYHTFLSGE